MTTPAADRSGLTEYEALTWLRERPGGRIDTTSSQLAGQWGWNASKLSRCLKQWCDSGHITRESGARGKLIITTLSASTSAPVEEPPKEQTKELVRPESIAPDKRSEPAPATAQVFTAAVKRDREPVAIKDEADVADKPPGSVLTLAQVAANAARRAREPVPINSTCSAPARAAAAPPPPASTRDQHRAEFRHLTLDPIRHQGSIIRAIGGLILALIAIAIAWYGLQINAWYGGTLGRTSEASALLAGLSVSADALALFLPAAARTLWLDGNRLIAAIAWCVWSITIVIALMSTVGFAALNISDTTAARGKVADETSGLATRIERLRTQRAGITETRSTSTIEAEIQRAQPGAAAVWRATSGCTDVTLASSGQACSEVLKLREALGTAQQRDAIDTEQREAEARLAGLPPVTMADPQADTAAKLINWVTFKLTNITPGDIHMTRVFGMTMMPQISGLVFLLAAALWQPGRRRERNA